MAGRSSIDDEFAAIRRTKDDPRSSESIEVLRRALAGKRSLAVAAAAEITGQHELTDLLPLLAPAFDRFMKDGEKNDKNCKAKNAVAGALLKMSADESALYRRGMRYVQREPVWGGSVDTAADLRGICALGLAQTGDPDCVVDIAPLLADPERAARANAARAVGAAGRGDGIPLLRFKIIIGDEDAQVLTECFGALLSLSPSSSLPFTASYLHNGDEARVEAAALALGQSRLEGAFPVLKEWNETLLFSERRIGLLAMAMLRVPAANDYLFSLIETEDPPLAAKAITALAIHKYDQTLIARVRALVDARPDRRLREAFDEAFTTD